MEEPILVLLREVFDRKKFTKHYRMRKINRELLSDVYC